MGGDGGNPLIDAFAVMMYDGGLMGKRSKRDGDATETDERDPDGG